MSKHKQMVYDMKGMHIGSVDVLEYSNEGTWKCKCKCGKIINVKGFNLRRAFQNNSNYMCEECRSHYRLDDLTGQMIGNWHIIKYLGNQMYECECSCSNHTVKAVSSKSLKRGKSLSCGCLSRNLMIKAKYKNNGDITNGIRNKRTDEQILASSSPEQLRNFILTNFNEYPTIKELSYRLNIGTCMTARKIHKFNLERYIDYNSGRSSKEKEIRDFIYTIYNGEIQIKNKSILSNNKELDICIPDKNIAIEFNGTYWHSSIYKDEKYHQNKSLECKEKGIRLIHIFEYEWDNKELQEKLKQYIKNIICNDKYIIYARETSVNDIFNKDSVLEFLNTNHLQGYSYSDINIGLTYKDNLIALMTFGKPRFNNCYQYELIRMAFKSDVNIVGGSEKLFAYFIKKYNPDSIISYCNISKFTGEVYNKLGFTLNNISSPGYVWVGKDDVLSRYQTQKHKLVKLGYGTSEQTEDEIMESHNYLKVYDSGNYVYTFDKKSLNR